MIRSMLSSSFVRAAAALAFGVVLYTAVGLISWWVEWRDGLQAGHGDISIVTQENGGPLEGEFLPTPKGIVRLSVRNVFGDPVPGAMVELNGERLITGEGGVVEFLDVPARLHTLHIEAKGYHPLQMTLRVNEGLNEPIIKYDSGLFPADFAVDFHVFHANDPKEEQDVFIQIGWSNGTQHPVLIRWFEVTDQNGKRLAPILDSPEGYRRLSLMYTALKLVTQPYALELRPLQTVTIDLPLIQAVPEQLGAVRLRILYGTAEQHNANDYEELEFIVYPVLETDFNPHRP